MLKIWTILNKKLVCSCNIIARFVFLETLREIKKSVPYENLLRENFKKLRDSWSNWNLETLMKWQ